MAVLLALCVTISHGFFSLARDGLAPRQLTRTSRHDTPWVANLLVFCSVVAMVVIVPLLGYATKLELPDTGDQVERR